MAEAEDPIDPAISGAKGKKSEPTEKISSIKVGEKDPAGNLVISVLAAGNEYVIYEIDVDDINYRLRVLMDGFDDESERTLMECFAEVKDKYIEAKGLLYRSDNSGVMKNRIAHALASCFILKDKKGNERFDKLIEVIRGEHKRVVLGRGLYLAPGIVCCVVSFIASVYLLSCSVKHPHFWTLVTSFLAMSLGGTMSIFLNMKSLRFDDFGNNAYYFWAGAERMILSFVAGGIAYAVVSSGLFLSEYLSKGFWAVMLILICAGFSEGFIPGILSKIDKRE